LESINIAYYAVSISISLVEIAAIGNTGRWQYKSSLAGNRKSITVLRMGSSGGL
jgi:hypothetical protein